MSLFAIYNPASNFTGAVKRAAGSSLFQFQNGLQSTVSAGVRTWTDLSGNGHSVTAPSVATSAGVTKHPVMGWSMDFDGGDYFISDSAKAEYTFLHDGTNRAIFQVSHQQVYSAQVYATADNATRTGIRTGVFSSSPTVWSANIFKIAGTAGFSQSPTTVPGSAPILTCDSVSGGNIQIKAFDTTGTEYAGTIGAIATPDLGVPNNDLYVGSNAGGSSRCTGAMAAFIILKQPTSQQVEDVCELIMKFKLGV